MLNLITVLNPYFYFLVYVFTWFTFKFLLLSLTLFLVSLIVDTMLSIITVSFNGFAWQTSLLIYSGLIKDISVLMGDIHNS